MTRESLVTQDWEGVVSRLGGATTLEQSARDTKAFLRARAIATAVDLLRLILAYCLSDRGLRSTAAWATAIGLANLSNVALLQRLDEGLQFHSNNPLYRAFASVSAFASSP